VSLEASESQWEWFGDAEAPVRIAGHSHCNAYMSAIADGRVPEAGLAVLLPRKSPDRTAIPLPDDEYWQIACGVESRVLAFAWQGNQHNALSLFDLAEPLRLHDCGEVGTVVPAAMVSAYYEPTLEQLDDLVPSTRAERVVLLGTPPPKSDEAVRTGLRHEPLLLRRAAMADWSADTMRVTPAAVRVGLWKILQADLEARAARLGALFVPVPASAQSDDGCLKPAYSGHDATHANGAFGALMLGEMEAALAREEVLLR
jgi:hypothetical protein